MAAMDGTMLTASEAERLVEGLRSFPVREVGTSRYPPAGCAHAKPLSVLLGCGGPEGFVALRFSVTAGRRAHNVAATTDTVSAAM